ncbi:MAG: alpha-L-fucosidase [Candidatus Cryptobacteroides sp.]
MKNRNIQHISSCHAAAVLYCAGLVALCLLAPCMSVSCESTHEPAWNQVAIDSTDTPEQIVWKAAHVVPSSRQFNWQRLELTAFAHFGLNTFADRQWGSGFDDPTLFNPADFDAEQWASVLEESGFKSLILTCKHHDGFCLWPSDYTDYSVIQSPWKNGEGDVVKEVSEACRRHGLLFGVYLSPWDRHDHRYGTPEYNDFFVNQLTELLTKYGPITEVWFDGACGEGPNGKRQEYDFDRWYRLVRELQPECVISIMGPDVRWVGTETGIGRETEWSVLPSGVTRGKDLGSREVISNAKSLVWYPAEADVSIRPSWFWTDSDDGQTKTAEKLMDIYFTSVGRNANLLLNIPPDRDGLFGEDEVNSLLGFAELRRKTFGQNLLEDASVRIKNISRKASRAVCDGDYDTSIVLGENDKGCYNNILFNWNAPQTFGIFLIQEDIRKGQRVESFTLEYKGEDGLWQEAVSGTTAGYKRILRFEPVTSSEARLTINSARHRPAISEIGLYPAYSPSILNR